MESIWEYKDGIRLKNLVSFNGKHSEFVMNVIEKCCVFPEGALKYVDLHCNMDVLQYHNPPEVEVVKKYFETSSPKNVLELGCGLGRSSVGFYKRFPLWKQTHFYLLDGNSGDKQICNVNYESQSFYNDLKLTKEFCLLNGIPAEQIHILDAEKLEVFSSIPNIEFDFVYSFLSIGFHWPITMYLKKLLPHLHSGSILCFGIRPKKSDAFRRFNDYQINRISKDVFDILEITTRGSFDSRLVLRRK